MKIGPGDKVLFRKSWSRQIVTGYVIAAKGRRLLIDYMVNSDFGRWREVGWHRRRHIITVLSQEPS